MLLVQIIFVRSIRRSINCNTFNISRTFMFEICIRELKIQTHKNFIYRSEKLDRKSF